MLSHCQAFLISTVEGKLGSLSYWLGLMCQHLEGALGSPWEHKRYHRKVCGDGRAGTSLGAVAVLQLCPPHVWAVSTHWVSVDLLTELLLFIKPPTASAWLSYFPCQVWSTSSWSTWWTVTTSTMPISLPSWRRRCTLQLSTRPWQLPSSAFSGSIFTHLCGWVGITCSHLEAAASSLAIFPELDVKFHKLCGFSFSFHKGRVMVAACGTELHKICTRAFDGDGLYIKLLACGSIFLHFKGDHVFLKSGYLELASWAAKWQDSKNHCIKQKSVQN